MHDVQRIAATTFGQLRFLVKLDQGKTLSCIPGMFEVLQVHTYMHAFRQISIALQECNGLIDDLLGIQVSQQAEELAVQQRSPMGNSLTN